ncbi:hypothetical protein [Afifella aestuarii]|uniref:hypothetical protein n=1 Tax=Afifella aestuarii TaxID=1909496 RepID=UPI000FE39962|nr:hypothetical protein [Afifella aestuarii]
MSKHLLGISVTALACALGAAPALAQTSGGSTGTSSGTTTSATSNMGSDKSPSDITCREVTALDRAAVPGVLYYIAGYSAAEKERGGSMDTSGTSTSTSGTTSTSSGMSSDTTTSGSMGADTNTSDMTSDSNAMSSDTGSMSSDGSSTSSDSATSGMASSQDKSGHPRVVAMRGFYEVPVERTLIACGETPESRASDVMDKQQRSGATDSGSMKNDSMNGGDSSSGTSQ